MNDSLLYALLAVLAYLCVVMVALRRAESVSPVLLVTLTSPAVWVIGLGVFPALGRDLLFWPFTAAYWFGALCFLMAFGAIYKSVSLRILLDLMERPDRSERYDALLGRYIQDESYQERLQILEHEGFVTREAAGYRLARKGRWLAQGVAVAQRLAKIERSG